jgi:electron transfer flavoprotein alpha subunit
MKEEGEVVMVLAAVEPDGGWSPVTLELLGDATAVASRLGGRVGAWVLNEGAGLDELAAHGCQVVWRARSDRLAGWSSEAVTATLARHLPPACRLLLLAGGARGEEVAALLAETLGADWVPDALTLAVTRTGALEITAIQPGGKLSRVHRAADGLPAVVTMRPGVAEARRLDRHASLSVREIDVDLADVPTLTAVERYLPPDPRTLDLVFARRIVSAGRGAGGPEGVRLVEELADALGASLGASRMVVDLGWAAPARQVGQTGRTVRPDLYVACGISGASHHLAGMRDSKHIVAINPDGSAPIHDVAHLSLRGDLRQVIPATLAALRRRATREGTQRAPA